MNILGPKNQLKVELDSEVFTVGQNITGKLILDVHTKINLLTLEVYVFGKEKIWLCLGQGDNKHHEKRVENFLEETVYLIGESDDPKAKPPKTTVPPGHYEYEFECKIPDDCPLPPSIEIGQSGVYYGLWAHIEDKDTWAANKKKNKKRKKCSQLKEVFVPFKVVGKFLPSPPVPKPVNFTMSKKFMLSTKALDMNIQMARDVWEGGETVKVLLSIRNDTNKDVKRIETMILPHWYQQLSKSKEFNSRMPPMFEVKWPDSSCPGGQTKQMRLDIALGQEIFPTMESTKILRYHHVIMLRVFVKGESFIEIGVPITIQCKGAYNAVELDSNVDIEASDDIFGSGAVVETSGGCCVIL